jgi:hypothetical protein
MMNIRTQITLTIAASSVATAEAYLKGVIDVGDGEQNAAECEVHVDHASISMRSKVIDVPIAEGMSLGEIEKILTAEGLRIEKLKLRKNVRLSHQWLAVLRVPNADATRARFDPSAVVGAEETGETMASAIEGALRAWKARVK